jgi:hypothetical protein
MDKILPAYAASINGFISLQLFPALGGQRQNYATLS